LTAPLIQEATLSVGCDYRKYGGLIIVSVVGYVQQGNNVLLVEDFLVFIFCLLCIFMHYLLEIDDNNRI